jgi:6-pyruvoyltetrahydropterin/6-carboxytetrahydropterin synthase
MHSVTVRIPFEAAHRLLGHPGKCKYIHGHSYVATVVMSRAVLDKLGMVLDFSAIKRLVKSWIDNWWDHNLILSTEDPLYELFTRPTKETSELVGDKKIYGMACKRNPTAEGMSTELYEVIQNQILTYFVKNGYEDLTNVRLVSVSIQETENCSATYTGG